MTKKFPLVPSYDAIMKLSKLNEFSKLSRQHSCDENEVRFGSAVQISLQARLKPIFNHFFTSDMKISVR